MCKNCGHYYNDKENFNWSCRTHLKDWGGKFWWCCGKEEKNSLGCKYAKHVSKEDEEDDLNFDKKKIDYFKNVKCMCCKELGHRIHECPRDPNFKTKADIEIDEQRIQKIKDFRTLFADTLVVTTHMLKKCIKIPKIKEGDKED